MHYAFLQTYNSYLQYRKLVKCANLRMGIVRLCCIGRSISTRGITPYMVLRKPTYHCNSHAMKKNPINNIRRTPRAKFMACMLLQQLSQLLCFSHEMQSKLAPTLDLGVSGFNAQDKASLQSFYYPRSARPGGYAYYFSVLAIRSTG